MPGAKTLARAERLVRSRKFAQAIALLESQVFHYRDNPLFYKTLGTACLRAGEFGGAHTYLTRAEQLRPGDTRTELALALVHLRRRDVPEALRLLLGILDREPRNRRALRLLALVRRTEDPSEFAELTESRRLHKYLPSLGIHLPRWIPLTIIGIAVAGTAIYLVPPRVEAFLAARQAQREGIDALVAPLPDELSSQTGQFRYVLTDREIEELVDRIGELFNRFRDNLARREANRLLLSNASPLIKERVRLVAEYFRTPTFVDFQDNFSYTEVAREPWLYEGVYVRWNGQTSNIAQESTGSSFTLLVGYTDQQTLEGTTRVSVPFLAEVEPGSVEVIARVRLVQDEVQLVATSIRPIVPRRE